MTSRRMLRLLAFAVVLVALPATPGRAADPNAAFAEANAAFAAGDYDGAAEQFGALVRSGLYSPALLYDLANAESRAGRTGRAVLHYLQALSLRPRDADVRANLRQTRAAANLDVVPSDPWVEISALGTVDEWALLGAALLWAACAIGLRWALRRDEHERLSRTALLMIAFLLVAAAAAGSLASTRFGTLDRAVVVGSQPALRVAPFDEATVSAELRPGQLVDVERVHERFALARTSEGSAGWIPLTDVPRILPRADETW